MVKCNDTKYIGDVISHDGKNTKNIQKRISAGMATITSIMIILNETSLGMFYFTIAMILRETILISSMLLNVEVWTNITKTEINNWRWSRKL